MPTCFVIQPFDRGPFDKRYDDVIAPAVAAADLEPYRVDRDPAAMVPITEIESGIRSAEACVADISESNPNVWYELGFAFASNKPVVLLCADRPDRRFPFDIQHRAIITYKTDSVSDFADLTTRITERLKAVVSKERRLETIAESSVVATVGGLSNHETVALATVAENVDSPTSPVPAHVVRRDMEKQGFTKLAFTLALGGLLRKGMAEKIEDDDQWGNTSVLYAMTDAGIQWLISNQSRLVLRESEAPMESVTDDDIPF